MLLNRIHGFRLLSVPTVAILCVVMVLTSACTKMVRVPSADYAEINPAEGIYIEHRLQRGADFTRHVKTIQTDRFKITESGLLIEAVLEDGHRRSVEPYEIRFEDIASVYRKGFDKGANITIAIVLGVVFFVVLSVVLLATYTQTNQIKSDQVD